MLLKILFILILLGLYMELLSWGNQMIAIAPGIIISFVSVVLYIFGLINNLSLGVMVISALGVILLTQNTIKALKNLVACNLDKRAFLLSGVFLMISGCWLFMVTRRLLPSYFDDFSHWLRICKQMNYENSLPTQPDMLFPTYVPGTAVWIYFVTRFIGYTESHCYFAQGLIYISCINALLAAFKKDKEDNAHGKAALVSATVIGIVLMTMDVSIYSLMVDSVLGFIALFGFITVLEINNMNELKKKIVLISVFSFIALIKTSGLLFVLFLLAVWMYKEKNGSTKRKITEKISGETVRKLTV